MKAPGHLCCATSKAARCTGFTLLELMIALLILSILLGLAVPSYQRFVQRGQRAEAVRLLMAAAGCQERIRTQSGYYDTTRCLDGFDNLRYTLRIEPPENAAATSFTLIAVPGPGQAENECGALSLDQSGGRGITGDASKLERCWGGR